MKKKLISVEHYCCSEGFVSAWWWLAGLEPATCRMLNCDPTLLCELLQLGDLSPTSSPLLLTGVSADKLKTSGSQDPRS